MQFNIRRATEHDYEFFYEVKKTVLRHYIETIWGWDEDFQRKFHAENFHLDNTFIVVTDHGEAGTVEVKEDDQRIFISSLYLLPQYQGKGIGTKIIADYVEQAKRKKKRVELEVLKLNTGAQKLYQRLGFTLTERDETKFFMFKDCIE